jgi:aldose 1-epimerase
MAALSLKSGDSEAILCPEVGAAIARYTWRGHDILRRAPDAAISERLVRQLGVYPLVPYSNRIGHAKLTVGDQTFLLRPNFSQEPHAVHGFGWQREWRVVSRNESSAELHLQHEPDVDWPFFCEATQVAELTPDSLTLTLSVKNTDARPMPAGLGFHPYFPLDASTRLQSVWNGFWKMGADSLPTEQGPVPTEANFSESRSLNGWEVDNCFTGWSRRAMLDYATHHVQIAASDACGSIVVYAPNDGRNFIALEPVTNINNAFALDAQGVANTGTRMLVRGESFEISMSISITDSSEAIANA